MPDLLSQQAIQERLPQGSSGSRGGNANAQACHIADDELGNKQINEIKDQMVDLGSKVLRASLSDRTVVEGSCRRAKYQGHKGQRSANRNAACQRGDVQKTIEAICILEYSLAEGKRIRSIIKDRYKFILTK